MINYLEQYKGQVARFDKEFRKRKPEAIMAKAQQYIEDKAYKPVCELLTKIINKKSLADALLGDAYYLLGKAFTERFIEKKAKSPWRNESEDEKTLRSKANKFLTIAVKSFHHNEATNDLKQFYYYHWSSGACAAIISLWASNQGIKTKGYGFYPGATDNYLAAKELLLTGTVGFRYRSWVIDRSPIVLLDIMKFAKTWLDHSQLLPAWHYILDHNKHLKPKHRSIISAEIRAIKDALAPAEPVRVSTPESELPHCAPKSVMTTVPSSAAVHDVIVAPDSTSPTHTYKDSPAPTLHAKVMHAYKAQASDEISLDYDNIVIIQARQDNGWSYVEYNGAVGFFPHSYLEVMDTPTATNSNTASAPPATVAFFPAANPSAKAGSSSSSTLTASTTPISLYPDL